MENSSNGKPLNGEKTHPLSSHAWTALRLLRAGPMPRQEFNPGICDRLEREALVETVELPSPYPSHKRGTKVRHLRITEAGLVRSLSDDQVGRHGR